MVVLAIGIVALVGSSARLHPDDRPRAERHARGPGGHRADGNPPRRRLPDRPDCTALAAGSDSAANGVVATWTITGSGDPRTVQVVSSYRVPGRLRADTLTTQIRCLP